MNRLFWGFFFVALDFELTLGTADFELLPDFIGYFLLMKGMEALMAEGQSFNKGRHWAFAMTLYSGSVWIMGLMNLTAMGKVGAWLLGLLGQLMSIFVFRFVVSGVRGMEQEWGWDLQGEKLKAMWLVYGVLGTLCYLLNWIPLVGTICAAAGAVTAVCLLIAMYGTRKRCRTLMG